MTETQFLAIRDIRRRWSCARSTVYDAIKEMDAARYLKRLYLGRVQRVALSSIEEYERRHAQGPGLVPIPRSFPSRRHKVTRRRKPGSGDLVAELRAFAKSLG